ncbi:Multi-sensor signal transduction histidine kinase [Desulfamplus magnetovallimortis]|uniref:histidine kinase n=1 Tax=Desulfamplus magnetovallimortis TaxID=1246637 RepID=A0A1W1HFH4_9BACT|nr:ATP-binding protein [Desulfamplus magnetovallimortis]SLM31244.1 Multi-sensor signal transduction histidine kinase [Desulfamplus magnetovallimortis]
MVNRLKSLVKQQNYTQNQEGSQNGIFASIKKINFRNTTLKNRIFFSTTAVILLTSVLIALFTRWILISSLTSELKERGIGIGHSIAESSRGYILTEDIPNLISLIFDARLGVRKNLMEYAYITDKQDRILAHTFTIDFPQELYNVNLIEPEKNHNVELIQLNGKKVYDVAVPVTEGIYRIGSVHVGLKKKHIDQLIGKLRTTFLAFVSAVTILFFIISLHLSKYIIRPITRLTKVSDEISSGNYDITHNLDNLCHSGGSMDEVRQLSDSFLNMTQRIIDSQEKLKESESKYRSLFAGGPNPIFVLDRKTLEIMSANPAAEEIYGYSKKALTGKPFTELGPFELHEIQKSDFQAQHSGKVTSVGSKVQCKRKNGQILYVNVHACPVRYQEKDAVIIATTDITEMVEKDSQLIQASKMTTLGEMSAGIAHELNQPLNAIKMGNEFIEMMIEKSQKIPDDELSCIVNEISGQVDRAVDIIRRLRDFGRKSDFTKERVNINRPVKSVLDIIGRQLRLQNIDIKLDMGHDIPPILAHPNRIEQVIFNLITNARDAINQKLEADTQKSASDLQKSGNNAQKSGINDEDIANQIMITTSTHGKQVIVTVSDTGMGIDKNIRERIFEAFFTTKKMGEGMGLGLSITNGIVEDYGGQITIESDEGKGTTFCLTFPAAQ